METALVVTQLRSRARKVRFLDGGPLSSRGVAVARALDKREVVGSNPTGRTT